MTYQIKTSKLTTVQHGEKILLTQQCNIVM